MNISENEIRKIYADVIAEYNTTPLSVNEGFVYKPNEIKLNEIIACAQAMPSNGATLLDVGTGMGVAPRVFKKLGCRTITLDNPQTGGSAAQNAALAGIETISCDLMSQRIELPDQSVDCVLFADVIEHFIHSPKRAIDEFFRVLKPDGICVATTPNALRISARIRLALGYSNWPNLEEFYYSEFHNGHHHEYTPGEFKFAFTRGGFRIVRFVLDGTVADVEIPSFRDLQSKSRGRDRGTHPLISLAKLPIYILERLVPNFRPSMLLVAEKGN